MLDQLETEDDARTVPGHGIEAPFGIDEFEPPGFECDDQEGQHAIRTRSRPTFDLEKLNDIAITLRTGAYSSDISCKVLIIEPEATVEGAVQADLVIVRGVAKGPIQSPDIRLEGKGKIIRAIEPDDDELEDFPAELE